MKIAVIGATGTIGSAVSDLLKKEGHEVVEASRKSLPAVNIDLPEMIESFYAKAGELDGVISAAGSASFGPLDELSDEQFHLGLRSKLMGQVNLVRKGMGALNEGGVFVLTSGMLATDPWPKTSAVSMVNAAIEGFVRSAALDMKRNQRICAVSPPLISETALKMGRESDPWPDAAKVAEAYHKAVTGKANGKIFTVEGYE
jgi:NAD(P)-dependent dehydrogenase (short-subunit alcohol dehydrogenase family)